MLGALPVGAIISLNCCIFWAVRRARLVRSGEEERGGGGKEGRKDMEMKRIVPSMRKSAQIAAAFDGNRWNLGMRNEKLSLREGLVNSKETIIWIRLSNNSCYHFCHCLFRLS